jgi:AraC family transcriptional regulator
MLETTPLTVDVDNIYSQLADVAETVETKQWQLPTGIYFSRNQYFMAADWEVEEKGFVRLFDVASSSGGKEMEIFFQILDPEERSNNAAPNMQYVSVYLLRISDQHFQLITSSGELQTSIEYLNDLMGIGSNLQLFTVCGRMKSAFEKLENQLHQGFMAVISTLSHVYSLFLYTVDYFSRIKLNTFACKFLDNNDDRAKIDLATRILLESLDKPITIKKLSRKVGMNECYLKKGFKEVNGCTIFQFYHSKRMEKAKYLLMEKGLTVTEVAYCLGYASVSNFSVAFRKYSGIRACEILLR